MEFNGDAVRLPMLKEDIDKDTHVLAKIKKEKPR